MENAPTGRSPGPRGWPIRIRDLLGRLLGRGRPAVDRELDEELAFHLEMETDKYVRQGMRPKDARRQALLHFGAMERAKEECREERRGSQLDMLMQDIRYALRMLRHNAGFASAAVLTLALGIGANAAIFSVIYGVLLRPLPYRDGNRLVLLHQAAPAEGYDDISFSIKEILDYREQATSLAGLVEYHQMSFVLLGRGEPERVETGVVSANFFDVLGVTPLLGRTFVPGDDDLDAEAVLVLSYGYWQRSFGGDPDIVGKVFEMNDRPHTVVGVLPPIPEYPAEVDVYMPTSACPFRANGERRMDQDRRAFANMVAFARLADGATVESANAEVAGIAQRFAHDFPDAYEGATDFTASATDLKEELTQHARPTLIMLLATAGLVLLIACANVANLTLARVMRREREMAVRAALGAARGRLLRQLVTESTVLALIGGALGLALAYVGLDMLIDFAARFTPRAVDIEMDGWVLAFTLAVSLGTGVVFGSAPLLVAGEEIAGAVKESSRTTAAGGRHTLRRALIVSQVALSFMLLIGAGLTLRSLVRLQQVDPGFDTDHVLSARVSVNWSNYDSMADAHADLDRLVEHLAASPFARSAALTSKPPYVAGGPLSVPFVIQGRAPEETALRSDLDLSFVSPGYFDVLGIPVMAGRGLDERDDADSTKVAVINETMARRYWPDESPLGANISTDGGDTWVQIVGVVGDTRVYGPDAPMTEEFYRPVRQAGMATWVLVRTVGDPAAAAAQLKEVAYGISGQNPISDLNPLATLRDDAVASPRLTATLLGVFALLALAVTVTGIAGVIAYSVSQRTRELGIRLALGARKGSVLGMVLRQGMWLVGIGVVVGLGGALAFGRVIAGLLYETRPTDPLTFAGVALCLVAAALLACFVPARRAISVDPVIALRTD